MTLMRRALCVRCTFVVVVLPARDGVLLRGCSFGFLSFWDTLRRYFLKSAPPPPFCEGSLEAAPEASVPAEVAAAEDEPA